MASLFCGTFDVAECDRNVVEINRISLSNLFYRVSFHTGVSEESILQTFRRASCCLSISQQSNGFLWTLSFGDGVFDVSKFIRLNEPFDLVVPISGDVASGSTTFSKADKALRQSVQFPGGKVEYTYSLFTGGMKMVLHHPQTGLSGHVKFLKRES